MDFALPWEQSQLLPSCLALFQPAIAGFFMGYCLGLVKSSEPISSMPVAQGLLVVD